ncbi:MAG TPA: metallophosphoesterase [Desulfobacterales bacterium]|nr:metallophosphoesterase [Desulfobacterales bacterium]
MRLAIISDVHGNLEALKQVLSDIDQLQVDGLACLGDNIGYGADSEEVVKLIRQRQIPCVMGNHELAVMDPSCLYRMNPVARRSLILTEELVSQDTLNYIRRLKASIVFHGSLCVHGCPPDSITTYLFDVSERNLRKIFAAMKYRICFVGHTHDLEIVGFDGEGITRTPLCKGLSLLQEDRQYIINIGSVGQPRDGDNNAKYVIWDDASSTIEVRFIAYDIAAAERKILELGFPEFNAKRLW